MVQGYKLRLCQTLEIHAWSPCRMVFVYAACPPWYWLYVHIGVCDACICVVLFHQGLVNGQYMSPGGPRPAINGGTPRPAGPFQSPGGPPRQPFPGMTPLLPYGQTPLAPGAMSPHLGVLQGAYPPSGPFSPQPGRTTRATDQHHGHMLTHGHSRWGDPPTPPPVLLPLPLASLHATDKPDSTTITCCSHLIVTKIIITNFKLCLYTVMFLLLFWFHMYAQFWVTSTSYIR